MLFVTNWLRNCIVEMWTVKTGLRLRLRLGLRLVMTVQFMTVQIKMGNHGTAVPHFLAHVCCRQTVGWNKVPFGMAVRVGPDHIVVDGNPAPT